MVVVVSEQSKIISQNDDARNEQNAVVYVCGDVGMSIDVEDTIKQILQTKGLSILESKHFVEDLIKNKRHAFDSKHSRTNSC